MKQFLENMVKQERVAWVSVLASLAVGIYYFGNVPLALESADLYTREMRRVVMTCFVLSLIAEIVVAIVSRSRSGVTEEDERDERIRDKAIHVAYRTMFGFLVLLVGHVVFYQGFLPILNVEGREGFDRMSLGELGMANALLGVLLLSSLVNHLAKIIYYRRGY